MLSKLRSRLTYANVMATIAVFMALGGAVTLAATSSCAGNIPCVNSDDIIDGEVKTPDVANLGITTPKLADSAVTSVKITNAAVTNAKLGASSVTNAKLGGNAVTTGKVLDGTVATADLANGAVTPAKVGTIPAASAGKSANQTIPDNSTTTLTFDTEAFDTASLHDTAVNNSRLTAPISGIYQVSAGVGWDANATGIRSLGLTKNGGVCCLVASVVPAAAVSAITLSASDLVNLSAGDFVEAAVNQTSGGNLDTVAAARTFLAMHWVGP